MGIAIIFLIVFYLHNKRKHSMNEYFFTTTDSKRNQIYIPYENYIAIKTFKN